MPNDQPHRSSIPPRAVATLTGVANGAAFDVTDANMLSFEIVFSDEDPPPGNIFDDVLIQVNTNPAPFSIGCCRFDPIEGAPRVGHLVPLVQPINCGELMRHGRLTRIDQRFEQLPLMIARRTAITEEFRRYTSDLVYDLRVYRSLFDDVDAGLARETPASAAAVQKTLRDGQGRRYLKFFDDRLIALEALVSRFSRAEHERHGSYFRRHVGDIIHASLFLTRTNRRPRGYAGDSVMMQYLYENTYRGETIFEQLMHKHPLESHAAQAVRNRRGIIANAITSARGTVTHRPLKFMSVACGPAWEVVDLFTSAADCEAYECTLLDQDEEALVEAQHSLAMAEHRYERKINARFVRDSVRTMLRARNLPSIFGQYDVLYSMGLFDYLTPLVAAAVLEKLYQLLEPGGQMIIGNYHVGNPTRWYMEYWMDWTLFYRSEDEMLALARGLPGAETHLSFDETRAQMFLHVRKPAG